MRMKERRLKVHSSKHLTQPRPMMKRRVSDVERSGCVTLQHAVISD